MSNNERIDAYFRNELSETERQEFLQDVETDASLNSDFKFQQNVTDGIKAFRKQELIAKLDNIQIASTGQSVLLKTIGIVGLATVATIGTYMWMNQDTEMQSSNLEVANEEAIIDPEERGIKSDTEQVSTLVDESTIEEKIADVQAEKTVVERPKETTSRKSSDTDSESESAVPTIVIPDVHEPESGDSMTEEENLSAPEAMSTSAVKLSTRNDVEVKVSKKYAFHYQIVDDALVLYGNFNESPFEVIELKTNEGINSYLYFKDMFYSLRTDSEEIRPLKLIENKELIKELQKRR